MRQPRLVKTKSGDWIESETFPGCIGPEKRQGAPACEPRPLNLRRADVFHDVGEVTS